MRVGGMLAQLAPPAELLSHPADAFVAGFVGRDRGYRALGFTAGGPPADHRASQPSRWALISPTLATRLATAGFWSSTSTMQPQGWLALTGVPTTSCTARSTPDLLNLGGTLATEDGTLREALDAALSSPSGRGVVVDGDGRLLGIVSASQVLARIEQEAAAARHAKADLAKETVT